jgi:hypothetical protein
MLKVCSQCQHQHYLEDFCPSNCDKCNSLLVGNSYQVKLLDKFNEALNYTSENLFQTLAEPKISENLLNDPNIGITVPNRENCTLRLKALSIKDLSDTCFP